MQPTYRISATPKARILTVEVATPVHFGAPLLLALQGLSKTKQGKVRHQPVVGTAGADKRGNHLFRMDPSKLREFVRSLDAHGFKNKF